MFKKTSLLFSASLLLAFGPSPAVQAATDVPAAEALFKSNDCTKCHSPDKAKKGPSLMKITAKYKGKADGQEKAIKNMTSGLKVKLEDKSEEDHKIIKTLDLSQDLKDPKELKNLADWMLSCNAVKDKKCSAK